MRKSICFIIKKQFKFNRYNCPCRCPIYLCHHLVRSFGPHTNVSSVAYPATLSLQTLPCISEIAHNLMAINIEHLLNTRKLCMLANMQLPTSLRFIVFHHVPCCDAKRQVLPNDMACFIMMNGTSCHSKRHVLQPAERQVVNCKGRCRCL